MKISKFFSFIYRKIIGDDIDTVKYMMKQSKEGKPILDPYKKKIFIQSLKEAPKTLFTESWYWILAIIFVFAMGYLVGLEKCEVACNNFIVENYEDCILSNLYGNDSLIVSPSFPILPSNITQEYSYDKNYSIGS